VIGMRAVQAFLGGAGTRVTDLLQPDARPDTVATGYLIEDWRIIDDSATGLRLSRRTTSEGARVSNGMLLAVQPENSSAFLLAHVCWTMAHGAELQIGISMLAGIPQPVDVTRSPDGGGDHEGQGLLMPPSNASASRNVWHCPPAGTVNPATSCCPVIRESGACNWSNRWSAVATSSLPESSRSHDGREPTGGNAQLP
jgi:hypothetical protein